MEITFTAGHYLLFFAAGIAAGLINTLAAGGGLFTLAALMLAGIPADLANGTNRVSVAAQSLEGVRGFHRHRVLDTAAIVPILVPTLSGSLIGSLTASYMPLPWLKPLLLGSMMLMIVIMLVQPASFGGADQQGRRLSGSPGGWLALFGAGLYGGFVQGGVGFLLLAALAGVLRYPLLAANALKLVCTAVFGIVALSVFSWQGQVLWLPGLAITVGTLIGVRLSVNMAVKARSETLRRILLAALLLACIVAFFR